MSTTRAEQNLRRQVIAEEPICRLQLAGCTTISQTADHIIPISQRPDLKNIRANMQGACKHCNYTRGNTPLTDLQPAKALAYFETAS